MPSIPSKTTPSLHGPAGSSAVKCSVPRPNASVITRWNTPSRCRIVGAHAPPAVGTFSTSNWPTRVATLPICVHVTKSREW